MSSSDDDSLPSKRNAADDAAAQEFQDKVRAKRVRPILLPTDLKGPKGLVSIRRSFPDRLKKSAPQAEDIASAANYASNLVSAYKDFARTLFPSLAPEDVLMKVESMGAKKEIKDYLQIMREELRREYLEGIYGKDTTERILHELTNGVVLRPVVEEEEEEETRPVVRRMGEAVYDAEEEEEELEFVSQRNEEEQVKGDTLETVQKDSENPLGSVEISPTVEPTSLH